MRQTAYSILCLLTSLNDESVIITTQHMLVTGVCLTDMKILLQTCQIGCSVLNIQLKAIHPGLIALH